jgi:hypothetical protein
MKATWAMGMLSLASLMAVIATAPAAAQSNPLFVPFANTNAVGALYKPDGGPTPRVAIIEMHRTANFLHESACEELSKRGFMVLCMNSRFVNNEASVGWENIAFDVKAGVTYLRDVQHAEKVLMIGFSGGGPTATYYEAAAENGPSYCRGANKLIQCTDAVAGLPRLDGIILRDGHPGNPINKLREMNPAISNLAEVVNENAAPKIDPKLDPFSPANGFNPQGSSHYSDDFKKRYFQAQSDKLNELIDLAVKKREAMAAGKYRYPDDDEFIFPRGTDARLAELDMSVDCCTVRPERVIQNDGSIVTEVYHSVRLPIVTSAETNPRFSATTFLTIRSFLSANAIRSKNAYDVDWCSSNNSSPCALPQISIPLLVMAMGAHYFVRDGEINYDLAASKDKEFIVVAGATHPGTPCKECAGGPYTNSAKNMFDYMAKWVNARWPAN